MDSERELDSRATTKAREMLTVNLTPKRQLTAGKTEA